jgi:hypothetical protein
VPEEGGAELPASRKPSSVPTTRVRQETRYNTYQPPHKHDGREEKVKDGKHPDGQGGWPRKHQPKHAGVRVRRPALGEPVEERVGATGQVGQVVAAPRRQRVHRPREEHDQVYGQRNQQRRVVPTARRGRGWGRGRGGGGRIEVDASLRHFPCPPNESTRCPDVHAVGHAALVRGPREGDTNGTHSRPGVREPQSHVCVGRARARTTCPCCARRPSPRGTAAGKPRRRYRRPAPAPAARCGATRTACESRTAPWNCSATGGEGVRARVCE